MMASTFVNIPIRVNCIAPGIFPSEMTTGASGEDQKSKMEGKRGNPAGKAQSIRVGPLSSSFLTSFKVEQVRNLIWRRAFSFS